MGWGTRERGEISYLFRRKETIGRGRKEAWRDDASRRERRRDPTRIGGIAERRLLSKMGAESGGKKGKHWMHFLG